MHAHTVTMWTDTAIPCLRNSKINCNNSCFCSVVLKQEPFLRWMHLSLMLFYLVSSIAEVTLRSSHALQQVIKCCCIRRSSVRRIEAFPWIVNLLGPLLHASLFMGSPKSPSLSEVMIVLGSNVEWMETMKKIRKNTPFVLNSRRFRNNGSTGNEIV